MIGEHNMTEINTQEHTTFDFELTEAMYERFWKFSFVRGVNYKLNRMIIFSILMIFGPTPLLFDLIYYGVLYGNHLDVLEFYDWILALFCLTISSLYLYRYFFGGQSLFRKTPQMHAHFTYEFDQEGVKVNTVSGFSSHQSEFKYSLIKKIYETDDAFYIMITNRSGYVVVKSGLIEGNLTAFRITLKQALHKKYALCR